MARTHYLRRNHRTLVPRRLVCLDTETVPELEGDLERHGLRCAAAVRDRLDPTGRPMDAGEDFQTDDAADLWYWLTHAETRPPRTWLYAHNVQFDLLAAGAFHHLPELGWSLHRWNIGGRSDWFWWRRGRASLVCLNSGSWFPMPLERVGTAVGWPKGRMPSSQAGLDEWLDYCLNDAHVLRLGLLRLIAWVHDHDLGSWRYTPAAQGMAAWRHRFMRLRPLVHGELEAGRLERTAYHAGRCEAYRLGELSGESWSEVDFVNAYPNLCAQLSVPYQLVGMTSEMTTERFLARPAGTGVIAEVSVEVDQPALPCRTDMGTVWGTGKFHTTLAGPELELALELGASVTWHRAGLYALAPVLRDYARWILAQLDGPDALQDPLLRAVVKRWGQSLVGRLGSRRRGWERIGDDLEGGAGMELHVDARTGSTGRRCRLAGSWWQEVDLGEGENSITAIAAWVTSAARVQLWRALEVAGRDHVAYLDTDGLLVDDHGRERLEAAAVAGQLPQLRVKRSTRRLEVWGPGAYAIDGQPRVKGLPRKAVALKGGGWSGERWQGVMESVAAGDLTRPLVSRETWQAPTPEPRGYVVDVPTVRWRQLDQGGAQAQLLDAGDRIVTPYRLEVDEGANVVGPSWSPGFARS